MKTIKGNLVLEKDTVFEESINVEGNILGKDGERYNLTVKGDITAWNISAGNISARDISARDISARDISARDITARDITAWNISARDISYYAFCIAYYNIKCKKIAGWRDGSFHKAIDGKIEVI
jgi:hypothetical protein